MKTKIILASLACTLACIDSYAAKTATFYCAPTSAIIFTPQTDSWAPYEYTSLDAVVKGGIQPALIGWGSADKALQFQSAVWTDQLLACNYTGLITQQQTTEIMVMVSQTLGSSPSCHFPNGKLNCYSSDPLNCPMSCQLEAKNR